VPSFRTRLTRRPRVAQCEVDRSASCTPFHLRFIGVHQRVSRRSPAKPAGQSGERTLGRSVPIVETHSEVHEPSHPGNLEPMFGSAGCARDRPACPLRLRAVEAAGSALSPGLRRHPHPPGDPLPTGWPPPGELEASWPNCARRGGRRAVFFRQRPHRHVGRPGQRLALARPAGRGPVCQYTPNEVKQAVALRRGDKAQVQAMVAGSSTAECRSARRADPGLAICHLSPAGSGAADLKLSAGAPARPPRPVPAWPGPLRRHGAPSGGGGAPERSVR